MLQPICQPMVQPAVISSSAGISSHGVSKFHRRRAVGIGTTMIVSALLGMIFNGIDIGYGNHGAGAIGHGFWVGALVIVAGAFGITAGIRKTRGLIMTFNVLCIISASVTSAQFIIGVIISVTLSRFGCHYRLQVSCSKEIAAEAMLAFLAVVEAIIAICGSVMCCKTACCCEGCCDDRPISQTVLINDIPLTVIYQPQNRAISVAYPVPVPISVPEPSQILTKNVVAGPLPDGDIHQATEFDYQPLLDAPSSDQPAFGYSNR